MGQASSPPDSRMTVEEAWPRLAVRASSVIAALVTDQVLVHSVCGVAEEHENAIMFKVSAGYVGSDVEAEFRFEIDGTFRIDWPSWDDGVIKNNVYVSDKWQIQEAIAECMKIVLRMLGSADRATTGDARWCMECEDIHTGTCLPDPTR